MTIYSLSATTSFQLSSAEKPVVYHQSITTYLGAIIRNLGISNVIFYYDIKSLDLKRQGNTAIIYPSRLEQTYIGFGNESWGDYQVTADIYIMGTRNITLEKFISLIHYYVGSYYPVSEYIESDKVVWLKIASEENEQERMRGADLYKVEFDVRVYITEVGGKYGIAEQYS